MGRNSHKKHKVLKPKVSTTGVLSSEPTAQEEITSVTTEREPSAVGVLAPETNGNAQEEDKEEPPVTAEREPSAVGVLAPETNGNAQEDDDDWVEVDPNNADTERAQAIFIPDTNAWFLVVAEEENARPANATDHEAAPQQAQHLMGTTLGSEGSTS